MLKKISRLKKLFSVSNALLIAAIICCLAIGCGKKSDELSLPEQEIKQMEKFENREAGNTADETGNVGEKVAASSTGEFKKFYVYADQGYFKNHFIPSGWMGDFGDIKYNDSSTITPQSRRTCIRIIYTAQKKQGAGWAGIYWQEPANNWGNVKGGFDLTGSKKLTFYARGEKGGETIAEVKMGGIRGEYSDTATSSIGPIALTPEWKQYSIDLKDEDMSLVIGGFALVISSMDNPEGCTIYLDEIAYE